jgi:hypothetical protein
METEKKQIEEWDEDSEQTAISEFVSGLAKLGQERQGIGYALCSAPEPVKTGD